MRHKYIIFYYLDSSKTLIFYFTQSKSFIISDAVKMEPGASKRY